MGTQAEPTSPRASEGDDGAAAASPRPRQLARSLPEAEQERLVALRSNIRDVRSRHERRGEQQRQQELELAEAYRQRVEERASRVKEARQEALSRFQPSRRPAHSEPPETDREHRELLMKYSSRLRPLQTASGGALSSRWPGPSSPEAHLPVPPRKPPVPPAPRPKAPAESRRCSAPQSTASGAMRSPQAGTPRHPSIDAGAATSGSRARASSSGSALMLTGLPSVAAAPRAAAGGASGEHEAPPTMGVRPSSSGPGVSAMETDGHGQELPGPYRSVMPRKEALRRKQQALLRQTDVVFYRQHMQQHFQRIVNAVELTFSDTMRKKKVNMNLANPLTVTELRNLALVGVRQQ